MSSLELSTTGFSRFTQCAKKYYYAEVLKIIPPYSAISNNMRRGTWLHSSLVAHYRGKNWQPVLSDLVDWVTERGVSEKVAQTIYEEAAAIMEQYSGFYSSNDDKLAGCEVLSTETPYFLKVPKYDATLRATVDLVAQTKRGIWLVEHKSTSEIPPANWRAVDPQTAMQLMILGQGGYFQPDGVLFNYLLTVKPSVPRIKQDYSGFYANTAVTTTAAFEEAWHELYSKWKGNFGDAMTYYEEQRSKLVNDTRWFQQYEVFRPVGALVETAKDIMSVLAMIRQCEERDHWPRAFHIRNCPTFCPYSDLCVAEFVTGKPSKEMRETQFIKDTGEREGR